MFIMKRWTIYCHTHIGTNRRYIGLTSRTMLQRWSQHVQDAKRKSGGNCSHFWNAIRFYGEDAFFHEVLEVCDSLEIANQAEESWIEFYDTTKHGFNFMKGGTHIPHPVKNPWDRPEYRNKLVSTMKLVQSTDEARLRISKSSRIMRSCPNMKEKFSRISKQIAARPEVREKISKSNKLRPESLYLQISTTYKQRGHKPTSLAIENSIRNRRIKSTQKTGTNCKRCGFVPESGCKKRIRNGLVQLECRICKNESERFRRHNKNA